MIPYPGLPKPKRVRRPMMVVPRCCMTSALVTSAAVIYTGLWSMAVVYVQLLPPGPLTGMNATILVFTILGAPVIAALTGWSMTVTSLHYAPDSKHWRRKK